MYKFTFLCVLGIFAVLQVPATWAEEQGNILASFADQNDIVKKHNDLRRDIQPSTSNMLKMSWNSEAAANAQRWASACSLKHSPGSARRISTSGCGENLYMSTNKDTWSEVIQYWYDEVKDWRYGVGSTNGKVVGHYTQVVWYRSNQVGCGMAYCPNAKYQYFYVCHYCPPGNFQYARPYKSGPSCGGCPNACDNKLCTNPCLYSDRFNNCPALARSWGCGNKQVASWCAASCKCTTQIV